MKISVDAEYLEELEKKAKRHDFFEGYIKGIEVAFAFAEELVKDIGNRKTEPRIKTADYCDICNHKGCENCVADSRDDYCVPSNFEPKTEPSEVVSCSECCKWWFTDDGKNGYCQRKYHNLECKFEPQTDCSWE